MPSNQDASKKVRFADDFLTAHIKQQLEYEDSQILENLAIFKELKQIENKEKGGDKGKKIIVSDAVLYA